MSSLLPTWLAAAWAVIFVLIALSHLRHTAQTTGQRRPWHASHVLMAIGMAFMYAPTQFRPDLPTTFWPVVFAGAGSIAAIWAIADQGRISTRLWFTTSLDLGIMFFMWSGAERTTSTALPWLAVSYLIAEGITWAFDLQRRMDGNEPIFSWRLLALETGSSVPSLSFRTAHSPRLTLIAELDINASMIAMTLGTAYMLIAMRPT